MATTSQPQTGAVPPMYEPLLADLKVAARFWAKVRKTDDCWEWTGATTSDGYGNLRVGARAVGAHRIAYELQVGPIPSGKSVLHQCDNPPCQRGTHLFIGSQMENVADMIAKGRENRAIGDRNGSRLHPESRPALRGEKCGHAKLTWALAREIRSRYALGGISHARLAREYGVVAGTIQQLVGGHTWKV